MDSPYEYTVLPIARILATMRRASITQTFIGRDGDVVPTHAVLNDKSKNQKPGQPGQPGQPGHFRILVNMSSRVREKQT